MVIKYLPSIYFEAVKNNFLSLDVDKSVPKILISNAHGCGQMIILNIMLDSVKTTLNI